MADKSISELTVATSISNSDLFVVQQSNTAKAVTGATFLAMVEAHGGIASVTQTSDYKLTFTFADGTTWTTPNSVRGETGATGDTGDDAEIIATEYGTSASSSTQPTTWTSTVPTVTGGNYLWTRYTWNNGDYTYMCTRYGVDGSGTGDMTVAVYDSDNAVANAGGIADYVDDKLADKQDTLTAGDNITITNNVISASVACTVQNEILTLTGTSYQVTNEVLYI